MLGRAYEYLIEEIRRRDTGSMAPKVVELIVALLAPKERMRVCDPTCGSGGMLIECAHYLERNGQNPRNISLNGQEKNLGTWAICKMNMLLHGIQDPRIEKGDTIRHPKLRKGGELMLFDRVIANPPFSLDDWGREEAGEEEDGYGRFRFGIPRRPRATSRSCSTCSPRPTPPAWSASSAAPRRALPRRFRGRHPQGDSPRGPA